MTDNNTQINNKNNVLQDILSHSSPQNNRKIPPLEKWSPTRVHDFDIFIADNAEWYHEGDKMTRQSLVDLFASVLWGQVGDDGVKCYFLKTPSDMYQIKVFDAPLLINTVDQIEQDGVTWIEFGTTNSDKIILNGSPLYFKKFIKDGKAEDRLYIDTRHQLTARVGANVLYHLIQMGELSEEGGRTMLTLTSGGRTHRVVTEVSHD